MTGSKVVTVTHVVVETTGPSDQNGDGVSSGLYTEMTFP